MGNSESPVGARLSLWVLFTGGGLGALGHEAARVHELYVRPQGASAWGIVSAAAGVALSVVVSAWQRSDERAERDGLPGILLVASSAVALLLGILPFAAFDQGQAAVALAVACVGVGVFVAASAALATWRAVARTTLALGFVEAITGPLALLAAGAVVAAVLVLEARVGFLRSSVLVSAWLALSAGTYPSVRTLVGDAPADSRWLSLSAGPVVLAAFGVAVAADRRIPLSELARYPDEVVFASHGAAHRYVITAAPGGYELFRNGQLRVAALDAPRYAAAIALPVLEAARGGRVLLLDGGEGVVERAILNAPGVTDLTVVSEDEEPRRLAARVPFLGHLREAESRASLEGRVQGGPPVPAPMVRHVTAELIPWLAASEDRWDVVIANLGAPLGYGEGKYYTRHFCALLAHRLGAGGLVVMPAISAFAAPEAFGDVRATLASAGLQVRAYHASIPTLGVSSFLIGSPANGASTVDALQALGGTADVGRDLAIAGPGHVATLHDERVVDGFAVSRERRGE